MSDTDWVLYRGDDRSWLLTVSGITGLDTATAARFTAKRNPADADSDAIVSLSLGSGVTIPDATHIRVTIPAAATDSLDRESKLYWDIQVVVDGVTRTLPDPSTSRRTLGTLLVRRDVTRTAP